MSDDEDKRYTKDIRNQNKPITRRGRPKKEKVEQPKATRNRVDGRKDNRKEFNYTFHFSQEELEEIPIYCPLSIKQEKYLQDEENDIIVWGGAAAAGKTQLSLLRILLAGMWDKHYVSAIARKSQRQMKQAGSLWSTGCKMYAPYGVVSNKIDLTWNFPSGAEVKCHHLDKNQDDWQGVQATEFLVDEAQQCLEEDVWYLTSRMRSQSKRKHQLRLTCNPLNSSFLCKWLVKAGYIGEDGLPLKEMDGKTTYMLEINGDFEWYNTRKEIEELYGKDIAKFSLSFTFYSASVYDNPYIRKHQPSYVHKLENLKTLEKQRLLLGNWFAKLDSEGYAKREWFNKINYADIPLGKPTIRCYDLAGSPVSPAYKDPDFTRGLKCTYDKETGYFYILDMVSIRDRAAVVQDLIEKTAEKDGKEVYVGLPVDAGQSGKEVADTKRAKLNSKGFKVALSKTRKGKLQRAEPFLMALQQGKVFVAPGVFEDVHYDEIENFTGERNGWHDDIIDALADCWSQLVNGNLIPTIHLNKKIVSSKNIGGSTLL